MILKPILTEDELGPEKSLALANDTARAVQAAMIWLSNAHDTTPISASLGLLGSIVGSLQRIDVDATGRLLAAMDAVGRALASGVSDAEAQQAYALAHTAVMESVELYTEKPARHS